MFAPPTAGEKAFADHFNAMKHSYALISDHDVVPYAWNRVLEIERLYSTAPAIARDRKLAIDAFETALIVAGVRYQQTRAHRFTAALESPPAASWLSGQHHDIPDLFAPACSQRSAAPGHAQSSIARNRHG